jgi:anti-sigma28 factor (negative regulator of flagellin synthesis)
MSNDRTTSLTELLNNDTETHHQPPPQQSSQPPPQQSQQLQQAQQLQQMQMMQLQEQQIAEQRTQEMKKKTMFDSFKDIDYKSMILIFAIILVLTSGVYSGFSRSYINGSFGPDNRITLMGSVVTALIGVLLFVVVKFFGKF